MTNHPKKSTVSPRKALGYIPLLVLSMALFCQRGHALGTGEGLSSRERETRSGAATDAPGASGEWIIENENGDYTVTPGAEGGAGHESSAIRRSSGPDKEGSAALYKRFPVRFYAGQRIRISCRMKKKNLSDAGKLSCKLTIGQNSGKDRQPYDAVVQKEYSIGKSGSSSTWEPAEMVLDIPRNADDLQCGVRLSGNGTIKFRDLQVEALGQTVTATRFGYDPGPEQP